MGISTVQAVASRGMPYVVCLQRHIESKKEVIARNRRQRHRHHPRGAGRILALDRPGVTPWTRRRLARRPAFGASTFCGAPGCSHPAGARSCHEQRRREVSARGVSSEPRLRVGGALLKRWARGRRAWNGSAGTALRSARHRQVGRREGGAASLVHQYSGCRRVPLAPRRWPAGVSFR